MKNLVFLGELTLNKTLFFTLGLLFSSLLLSYTTPQNSAAQNIPTYTPAGGQQPAILVTEGVTSFTLVPPRIHWNTSPPCVEIPTGQSGLPMDDGPEAISRIPTYDGPIRRLLFVEEVTDECTPYAILSNLIADENYVYWADHNGLQRLPIEANTNNPFELVSDDIVTDSENIPVVLTDAGSNIYAAVYNSNNTYTLWRVNKAFQVASEVLTVGGSISNLSYDGSYLYWLNHTNGLDALYRTERTGNTYSHQILGVQVTGYHAEGERTACAPACVQTHYVFMAKGSHVDRYDNINGNTQFNVYVSDSSDPQTVVYELVTDVFDLFVLEERPIPNHLPNQYLLHRTGRGGGIPELIYLRTSSDEAPLYNLRTDNEYLYWIDYSGGGIMDTQLLKLPNDAEEIPTPNLTLFGMTVTQGIQGGVNPGDNHVPLIQQRRTFVRLRAASLEAVGGVTAVLYRENSSGLIIGGPLYPINGIHRTLSPTAVPDSVNSQFLFELPPDWLHTSPLRLRAELNPYNDPLELEVDRADNTLRQTLNILPSPRLEVDFYVLTYTVNGVSYTPRPDKDVEQTFSYIRRTYPLASKPAYGDDPSPGFRPHIIPLDLGESLGVRVMRTHPVCYLMEDPSSCASSYVNSLLQGLKYMTASDNVFYGLMSDEANFPRGAGMLGVASGPAGESCCWDTDGAYTDWYTAHEIGHALGRHHPVFGSQCGGEPTDWDYPYLNGLIGDSDAYFQGFDSGDPAFAIEANVMPWTAWADFMTYCDNQWISDYTYNGLYGAMMWNGKQRTRMVAPAGAELLGVYGIILPEADVADIHLVQQFDTGAMIPELIPGDYAIRLRGVNGALLAEYAFTPDGGDGSEPEDEPYLAFGQIVEWVAGTAVIQIVTLTNSAVLGETAVSANPPQISNVVLQRPSNPVAGTVTLAWSATDADNDDLTFDIQYSRNAGIEFRPVLLGVTGSSAQIDMDALGGGIGLFRVTVSDGVHLATATSPAYVVANKPPQPQIHTPGDGDVIQWGRQLQLIGSAYDLQDGTVEESNLLWRLGNSSTLLGAGSMVNLDIDDLPVGEVEIRLIATNSAGQTATDSITLTVHDDLVFPGPTLDVSPSILSWHLEPGTTELQTAVLTIHNPGTGTLNWTAVATTPWLTLSATNGTATQSITVTANTSILGNVDRRLGHINFTGTDADGQVVGTVSIPVNLAAGALWFRDTDDKIYLPLVRKP